MKKLRSKVAKFPKFPKRENIGVGGSKFYNFEKKIRGINSTPRSLPTNFTYTVPPPPGVIKCLSYSAENVSKIYQLSRVSSCHLWDYICPTGQFNFDGREDIIVFPTGIIELSHLSIFFRACVCVGCTIIFCQLLPLDPWNSVFCFI